MTMTGAQALMESLKREGVEVIFGFPGGALLPVYDALHAETAIRHVLVRHEQGAAHMADGYARSTGRVGVCMATSGPGATNLVTGIATAYMDSVPIVAITGQVPVPAIGRDSFQEADITGITMPITKHNYLLKRVEDLPQVVRHAFYIASTGRRGPVLIDLPRDVAGAELEYEYPEKIDLRSYRPTVKGHELMIRRAAEMLAAAERPVIYAGGGVIASGASEELVALAERLNAPVTTTLMGKGAFPDDDPLCLGMPGMHGTAYANYALNDADLILAVGVRFDDRVTGKLDTFAPKAQFIHIDIDPAEIGKSVAVAVPIVGDVKQVLTALLKRVSAREPGPWLATVEEWKQRYPLRYKTDDGLKPQFIIEEICRATGGEAIVTTEVGQQQMWAAQYYRCQRPRRFLSSGGLGTMGYGFPAAIGAQVGNPDAAVWDIAGDGSIQMNIQELATAVSNALPVKVAIMNNGYLGMVRQWQELFFDRRYSQVDLAVGMPDFVKLAEAYGAVGLRVAEPEEVRPAIDQAMGVKDRPCLIDFWISREENVMPFVPAGGSIDQMMID
ncbi:acetolactate synthase catalytic subunit [candidate division KD3-62 bacterium DG_56]|uniref:Acetolactate synthase n=1 Tax=candidate division KD3-62 bacterium DG_56 TaxID=1704032 RepID=A0A0S7XNL7_9BACT|nr:MAG: acetolactate synthase catalytic subunit [candidate division KD3-62 bacterium DG_56]